MEQQIHFCTTQDGVRIAYATVGEGPPLVKAANWLSHLEFDWRSPVWRHLLREFARDHTFIRYDERGNGLSDWNVADLSFDAWVEDLESVIEASGVERFPLLGISQGGAVAIAYAVRHPEKVSHLILYGAYSRGWITRDSADEIEQRQAQLTLVKLGWGKDNPAFRQLWTTLYAPDATPEQAQSFNDLQRISTSPENAVKLLNIMGEIDVVDLLPQVKVPTLVLHCRDESGVPFEEGRLLASSIPGARFVPLEGRNHLLLEGAPSWGTFVKEIRRFLGTDDTSALTELSDSGKAARPDLSRTDLPERYSIVSLLGVGGMGEVYLAEDTKLGRKVALKTLPTEFTNDRERLRRFQHEARAASALNHPNLLTIHEIGAEAGAHFIAAEYIDGDTLRAIIKRGRMKIDDALDIAQQAAFALTAAHGAGIVHRDIKPDNIMVRLDGIVKVLDFGLAKLLEDHARDMVDHEADTRALVLTDPGRVLGTPAYMSPEQARGSDLDARTDIWSLGVVLYEMVAGRAPFRGETKSHTVVSILENEPPPLATFAPDAPAELQRIVRKALTKDRDSRYQTARDLMIDLKSLRRDLDIKSEMQRAAPPNIGVISRDALSGLRLSESRAARSNSIAVLPFTNMSADAENEYFCDGLAEELLNGLAKIEDLKVAARTSAFSFKGKNANISEIGSALSVKTVLEGSVRKSGNRLRISVQLVSVEDGYQLWSERYDREMKDIFDVQDEITLAVIDALKVRLLGQERAAMLKRYVENTDAYELILKGRYYCNKHTIQGLFQGIEYFERAIVIEPECAPAYAEMGICYIMLSHFGLFPPHEIFPKGKAAVTRALEIDDQSAEAHSALANILFYYEWDWAAAEREFKRAIELSPHDANTRWRFGLFLVSQGRFANAINEGELAVKLDPLSLLANLYAGFIYLLADRPDRALEQVARMIEIEPNFHWAYWLKGGVCLAQEKYGEAVEALEKSIALGGILIVKSYLGSAYGFWGKRDEALGVLNELLETRERQYIAAINVARVYNGLGELESACAWLEKSVEERNGEIVLLNAGGKSGMRNIWRETLRADPRYQDILRRVPLPAGEIAQSRASEEVSGAPRAKVYPSMAEPLRTSGGDAPRDGSIGYRVGMFVVMLLIAAIALATWFYLRRQPAGGAIDSVVVLPFVNTSNDSNAEYLSDGLAESLMNNLSQVPNLKVISRNAAFRYKGQDQNAQRVGKDLNVRAVVTGTVKQIGDQIVISISLDDALDNHQIWGEQYNRKLSDALAVQQQISREITDKLRLQLSGDQQKQLTAHDPTNPEAYQDYLKGRYYWNKREKDYLEKAINQFQLAASKDPRFALAYVGLADSYTFLEEYGYVDPAETYLKAKFFAQRALEIDPSVAEAHASLGNAYTHNWEWEKAESEFKQALALNPKYGAGHHWYNLLLRAEGRFDESLSESRKAYELDPLSLTIGSSLAKILMIKGEIEPALEQCRKLIELDPNSGQAANHLGLALLKKGQTAEGLAALERSVQLSKLSRWRASLGYGDAVSGKRVEALAIAKELEARYAKHEALGQDVASVYSGLGQKDLAFTWLEKDFQAHSGLLPRLRWDIQFEPIRSDARYADLLHRMGL